MKFEYNLDDATHDIKQASIAAFISAAMSTLVIVAAMASSAEGVFGPFADPVNFIDVALVLACGVGLRFYSRTAAVTLVIYFIFAKIFIMLENGRPSGLLFTMIWLYFYWKGIRGSFAYHRLRKEADSSYRSTPVGFYYFVIPLGGIVLSLVVLGLSLFGLGILAESGAFVDSAVITGDKLSKSDLQLLLDEGIIRPDETVLYFYSAGITSISDDGNLLTDQRVVSYERIEGVLEVYAAKYEDVAEVIIVEEGNFIDDTIVEINTTDDDAFLLFLSPLEEGDQTFINELRNRVRSQPDKATLPAL
ncbi:hypothetical protein [Gimesia algae]|uniref:Uncharacterized protein n=1 Tax=Gimesia algae TaxID=2527971 RepID=A0A517V7U1_9PLAN|nr:hypothetical protein [Gimesia algae]QDT89075.1 hypothetical protein Pan161_07000 [Gimesia algae]